MLRKEFEDVLKQSAFFLVLMLCVPLLVKAVMRDGGVGYMDVFNHTFALGVLGFMVFLGNSLFMSDRKQRSLDYLFSLPYSRMRLLGMKLLPRVAAVFVFAPGFLLMGGDNAKGIFLLLPIAIFIVAICLSISMENYFLMALLTAAVLYFFVLLPFVLPIFLVYSGGNVDWYYFHMLFDNFPLYKKALASLLMVTPFVAAFIGAYKKVGIKPVRNFNKRYWKVFAPIVVVVLIINASWIYAVVNSREIPGNQGFYLTDKGQVLECGMKNTRVYSSEGVTEIKGDNKSAFRDILGEDGNYVYGAYNLYGNNAIARLNKQTLVVDSLYTLKMERPRRWYHYYPRMFGNTIAFIEPDHKGIEHLVLLDVNTGGTTRSNVDNELLRSGYEIRILGTDTMEKGRFWILEYFKKSKSALYRLWEKGEMQFLSDKLISFVYVNGYLLARNLNGACINRLSEEGLEPIKDLNLPRSAYFRPTGYRFQGNVNRRNVRYLYDITGKKDKQNGWCLDLEALTCTEVPQLAGHAPQQFISLSATESYFLETAPNKWGFRWPKRLYRINGAEVELAKEFDDPVDMALVREFDDPANASLCAFYTSKNGIISIQGKEIKTYNFANSKENTFQYE
ncbi:MAG: ABC transporter permease [bacterium]|nr:ABC transporter permease [bacterium]